MPGKDREITGRGRISTSVRKQAVDKYLRDFSGTETGILRAGAAADGPDAGAAYAAVSCAAARVYAMGGQAENASVQITLPRGTGTEMLSDLSRGVKAACEAAGIHDAIAQACVLEGDFLPRVTVFASGERRPGSGDGPGQVTAGDGLVMAGYAGLRGGVLLAHLCREALTERFSPSFVRAALDVPDSCFSPLPAACAAFANGADAVYICGEGGVFTGIREFAEQKGLGVKTQLQSVLLQQETVEICDYAGVSPYMLMSQGCVLIASRQPQKVQIQLAGAGIPACVIGYLTGGNDRVIINGEETRFLEPFRKDSFYAIGNFGKFPN